jgi:RNA polymerase sigma-70 factor, ECF subfamily
VVGSVVGDRLGGEAARFVLRVVDDRVMSFQHLVDRELDHSYRLAAVILNDRIEAEDAVHDAALVAWRRWDDLRDPARFEAWFRRILVNGCRDRLRAKARHRVVDVGRELTEAEHPQTSDATRATEIHDALDRAIDTLGPDERLIVALRFHADLTVPVIAATIGIPEGTVKSRLHHALGRLRVALVDADR